MLQSTTSDAQEPARFALLISNQKYHASVGILRNPHNDTAVVGVALQKRGFTLLPPVKDARRSTILGAVRELVQQLNGTSGEPSDFCITQVTERPRRIPTSTTLSGGCR